MKDSIYFAFKKIPNELFAYDNTCSFMKINNCTVSIYRTIKFSPKQSFL